MKRLWLESISRYEGKLEWARSCLSREENGKARLVHSRSGLAKTRRTGLREVEKLRQPLKTFAKLLAELPPE
jgi:hypothetical protein